MAPSRVLAPAAATSRPLPLPPQPPPPPSESRAPAIRATTVPEAEMDRYQRVERPRTESATIEENEIRITAQGLIRNYASYATSLLQVRALPPQLSHLRRVAFRRSYGGRSVRVPCFLADSKPRAWKRWVWTVGPERWIQTASFAVRCEVGFSLCGLNAMRGDW